MDIIAEEQLENAPERIEDPNDSSVDLLGDAIVEVYGPSHKHQRMEDMIAEETVEQAKVLSGSSKTVETEQPIVQLTTSTPEKNRLSITTEYMLQNKVGTSEHNYATGCYTRWARAYM
jgi:hypothetical protein